MLHPERSDASRSDQHFNPKKACHNSIIPYYSTKPAHSCHTLTSRQGWRYIIEREIKKAAPERSLKMKYIIN